MKITSQKGIELIKNFETLHDGDLSLIGLQPKMCPAGIWTEGYGHAILDKTGKQIKGAKNKYLAYDYSIAYTESEAETLLADDLGSVEKQINRLNLYCTQDQFDAIICGDVIEHLRNPECVLKHLAQLLTPEGVLIGTVPNTGHWSIVMDLAQGRFEMIPVGLLCMSHIRFFTEIEFRNLLRNSGLEIEILDRDTPPPTPMGERFISTLVSAGMGDELSLRTSEFRFQAYRG